MNKMINKKYIIMIVLVLCFVFYKMTTKVDGVYKDDENGSTIISISNAPIYFESMVDFWNENKNYILSIVGRFHEGEKIIFVKNSFDEKSTDDDIIPFQICIRSKKIKPCFLSKDRLISLKKERVDGVDTIVIKALDNYLLDNGHLCLLFLRGNGDNEAIKCDSANVEPYQNN